MQLYLLGRLKILAKSYLLSLIQETYLVTEQAEDVVTSPALV